MAKDFAVIATDPTSGLWRYVHYATPRGERRESQRCKAIFEKQATARPLAGLRDIAELNAEAERAKEYRRLTDEANNLHKKLETAKGGSQSGDPQLNVLRGLLELTQARLQGYRHLGRVDSRGVE